MEIATSKDCFSEASGISTRTAALSVCGSIKHTFLLSCPGIESKFNIFKRS
jgi:hypothetical protein